MSDAHTDASTSPLVHLLDTPSPSKPAVTAPKVAPSAAAWADMSPQDRFAHQQAEGDRLNGTYRPEGFKPGVRVDEATYEKMTYQERIDYAASFQAKPSTNADGSPADPDAPAADDQNAPRIKVGEAEFSEKEILDAMADKAARDANKNSLPTKPEDYRLDLPRDLKLPEGVQFKFDEKDPIKGAAIAAARNWAKVNELTQEQFSGLLGLYAGAQAHEQKMLVEGARAEREKMGPAGVARIDAVTKWLKATVGDDITGAMLKTLILEKQVAGFEKIIQRMTSQGVGTFRQTGREPPDRDGRLPGGPEGEKIWNSMSYTQQKQYAEKFSQS